MTKATFKKHGGTRGRIVWTLLAIAAIMAAFYVLNCFVFLCSDDYGYCFSYATGERIVSLSQVIPSAIAEYHVHTGKALTNLFAQIFLLWGKPVFNAVNTVGFLLLLCLLYLHIYGTFRDFSIRRFLFLAMLLFACSPNFGQSFLWLSGAANYLFGNLLVLLFLLPYRIQSDRPERKSLSPAAACGSLLLGMLAGATLENMSVAAIALVAAYLAFYRFKRIPFRLWHFTGLAGNIAGFVFLLLSPGEQNRISGETGGIGGPVKWFLRAVRLSCNMTDFLRVPLVILAALLLVYLCRRDALHKIWWKRPLKEIFADFTPCTLTLIYLWGFLASVYSVMAASILVARAWSGPLLLLLIAAGNLDALLYPLSTEKMAVNHRMGGGTLSHDKADGFPLCVRTAAFLCAAAISIGCYVPAVYELRKLKTAHQQRVAVMETALAQGERRVEVPVLWSVSPYAPFEVDLRSSPSHWRNQTFARYYGMEEVTGVLVPSS